MIHAMCLFIGGESPALDLRKVSCAFGQPTLRKRVFVAHDLFQPKLLCTRNRRYSGQTYAPYPTLRGGPHYIATI